MAPSQIRVGEEAVESNWLAILIPAALFTMFITISALLCLCCRSQERRRPHAEDHENEKEAKKEGAKDAVKTADGQGTPGYKPSKALDIPHGMKATNGPDHWKNVAVPKEGHKSTMEQKKALQKIGRKKILAHESTGENVIEPKVQPDVAYVLAGKQAWQKMKKNIQQQCGPPGLLAETGMPQGVHPVVPKKGSTVPNAIHPPSVRTHAQSRILPGRTKAKKMPFKEERLEYARDRSRAASMAEIEDVFTPENMRKFKEESEKLRQLEKTRIIVDLLMQHHHKRNKSASSLHPPVKSHLVSAVEPQEPSPSKPESDRREQSSSSRSENS